MKIGYLGAGTWGFALVYLLHQNHHEIVVWTRKEDFAQVLEKTREHPKLNGVFLAKNVRFTTDIREAVEGADVVIESVTSRGIRPVCQEIAPLLPEKTPFILTSKGIEQDTVLLLPEVAAEVLGEKKRPLIGCLSGPSHAEEVVKNLPTSVVASSYSPNLNPLIVSLFTTSTFRVYPTNDLRGICFGGAMKNIMAIACGISDGLGFGANTKAALMTRGLHEMRKLAEKQGCKTETLNGLSGMGDLCVSCLSTLSRNYQFGAFLAKGYSLQKAKEAVGMVVEGADTCRSALSLAKKCGVPVPITEAACRVIYEGLAPQEAVKQLLTRTVKEEHL
ncbi:MAG: NAD(P)H-dependent glycerol-3-phosphate dehydrogenase [Chlamydiota bacterium]